MTNNSEPIAQQARFIGTYSQWDIVTEELGPTWCALFQRLEWLPTAKQREVLRNMVNIMFLGGAEQGGKTALAAMILVLRYFIQLDTRKDVRLKDRRYWIAGHERKMFEGEWEELESHFKQLGLYSHHDKKTDIMYLKDGTKIEGILTADARKISRFSPLGTLACEAGQMTEQAYKRLLTRSLHRDGWIIISGTFEGNSMPWYTTEFVKCQSGLMEGAKAFSFSTWDNSYLYPSGAKDNRVRQLKEIMGEEMFMERAEGKPMRAPGLVYEQFDPGFHLATLPLGSERDLVSPLYNPYVQIHIWEDPGFDHVYAMLAAQYYGGILWIFDEMYRRNVRGPDMIRDVTMKPWWSNPDKRVVSDPHYANVHHVNSSMIEIWQEVAGLNVHSTVHRVEEGIARVKDFLGINHTTGLPYMIVDGVRCPGLLSEMGIGGNPARNGQYAPYCYEVDSMGVKTGLTPKPINDDACDALRNGIVDLFGFGSRPGSEVGTIDANRVSTIESRGYQGYGQGGMTGDPLVLNEEGGIWRMVL